MKKLDFKNSEVQKVIKIFIEEFHPLKTFNIMKRIYSGQTCNYCNIKLKNTIDLIINLHNRSGQTLEQCLVELQIDY